MLKRIVLLLTILTLMIPLCVSAEGEGYTFDAIHATMQLPGGLYETVLSQDNLDAQSAFLSGIGLTAETAAVQFKAEGILLKAYDRENGRIFILSATKDDEAEQYFNINEHTPEVRAGYRKRHAIGEFYRSQGYLYKSVEWKNFKGVGRWLMLKYDFKKDGEIDHRGFQRRTIYNGYTITFDMQVEGKRALSPGDNSALNAIFDTLSFTQVEALPELPVKFIENNTAPAETSEPSFVMSGQTAPEAKMTAVIGSFSTAQTQVIETTAKKNGAYSFKVTLPNEDMYFMTLTVQADGVKPLEKQYAITYRKGLMKVTMTNTPPEQLEKDSVRIAGIAEKGAEVQLDVNGKTTTKKVNAKGVFTFTVDTYKEGEYTFNLVISRKGYEPRTFSYKGERRLTPEARTARITGSAQTPTYKKLIRNIDRYDGKVLTFEGYLVSVENKGAEWIMLFALRKNGEAYDSYFMLTSDKESGMEVGSKVKVYGTLVGTSSMRNAQGVEAEYPKLQLNIIEKQL